MGRHYGTFRIGEEVVLLPIGDRALPGTRTDLWDSVVASLGRELFGRMVVVARVTAVDMIGGRSPIIELEMDNGATGGWPADRVVPLDELAPIGLDPQVIERWLDS